MIISSKTNSSKQWTELSPPVHNDEKEALEFLKKSLPKISTFHGWSNFEFKDRNGEHEIDALIVTPNGLFLVEIKSYHGELRIERNRWLSKKPSGRRVEERNPISLANRKAKYLRSVLKKHKAFKNSAVPWIFPVVFVSTAGPRLKVIFDEFDEISNRDTFVGSNAVNQKKGKISILDALIHGDASNIELKKEIGLKMIRQLLRAMSDIANPSKPPEKLGSYTLTNRLYRCQYYSDYEAIRKDLEGFEPRRARIFHAIKGQKGQNAKARNREYRLLNSLRHDGILKVHDPENHAKGPALVMEYLEESQSLTTWLDFQKTKLTIKDRIQMLRAIGDTIAFAHGKNIVHRALNPNNILVLSKAGERPNIRIINWFNAEIIQGTKHQLQWLKSENQTDQVYLAPEMVQGEYSSDPVIDVFSLGCIAAFLFTGEPPAKDIAKRNDFLSDDDGLRLAYRHDDVIDEIDDMIFDATRFRSEDRFQTITTFLRKLNRLAQEVTMHVRVLDPQDAQPADILDKRFLVEEQLGVGGSGFALLVFEEQENLPDRRVVLKCANDKTLGKRISAEARALLKIDSPYVVKCLDIMKIGGRPSILITYAGETLYEYLRHTSHVSLALIERFGSQICEVLQAIENAKTLHRDIKPQNIGVKSIEKEKINETQLMLFDFSLAEMSLTELYMGTERYRDPLLIKRKKWDAAADRYSAAVVMFEIATGMSLIWSSGDKPPSQVKNAQAIIDPLRLPHQRREKLEQFFRKSFAREVQDRFHDAKEMADSWKNVFLASSQESQYESETFAEKLTQVLVDATLETRINTLPLTINSISLLEDRDAFLLRDVYEGKATLENQKGMVSEVHEELVFLEKTLKTNFTRQIQKQSEAQQRREHYARAGLHDLRSLIFGKRSKLKIAESLAVRDLLGFNFSSKRSPFPWESLSEIAIRTNLEEKIVRDILKIHAKNWSQKNTLFVLREQIADYLDQHGNIATDRDVSMFVFGKRGTATQNNKEARFEGAVIARIAVEAEAFKKQRYCAHYFDGGVLVAKPNHPILRTLSVLKSVIKEFLLQMRPSSGKVVARALREKLQQETIEKIDLRDDQLIRIAATLHPNARVSAQNELYKKNLSAEYVLQFVKLPIGKNKTLSIEEVNIHLQKRYPTILPLPKEAKLVHEIIRELDLPYGMTPTGHFSLKKVTTRSLSISNSITNNHDDQNIQAIQTLNYRYKQGGFLALIVSHSESEQISKLLADQFKTSCISLDKLLIEAMKKFAENNNIPWENVRNADAKNASLNDKRNLRRLVSAVWPGIRNNLFARRNDFILEHVGLIAHFNLMTTLEELRDHAGTYGAAKRIWIVLPTKRQSPFIDDMPLSTISSNQHLRLPSGFLTQFTPQ